MGQLIFFTWFKKKPKSFYITMNKNHFRKGDLLVSSNSATLVVLRKYENTKFRRFLKKLGVPIRLDQLKVRNHV